MTDSGVALLSVRLSKHDAFDRPIRFVGCLSSNHTLDNDTNERLATAAGFFHRGADRTFQDGAFNSVPGGRVWNTRYWIERENRHLPSNLPARIVRSPPAIAPVIGRDVRAVQNVLAPSVKHGDEETRSATNSGKKSQSDHSGFLRMSAESFAGERSKRQRRPDVKVKR
jgi:hypothetical protein